VHPIAGVRAIIKAALSTVRREDAPIDTGTSALKLTTTSNQAKRQSLRYQARWDQLSSHALLAMVLRLLLLATPGHLDRVKALMGTHSPAFAVFHEERKGGGVVPFR
jgi:hypothetical protein